MSGILSFALLSGNAGLGGLERIPQNAAPMTAQSCGIKAAFGLINLCYMLLSCLPFTMACIGCGQFCVNNALAAFMPEQPYTHMHDRTLLLARRSVPFCCVRLVIATRRWSAWTSSTAKHLGIHQAAMRKPTPAKV